MAQVEGQNTENGDSATSKWLKKNKLKHLIAVFAEESITIDELMDMAKDTLDSFLDELVNDDAIKKFKKRDKIRIISKLKLKQNDNDQNAPKPEHKQQQKPQRIIITEAEATALDSLDNKYKQLSLRKKSIEERLNEFETEYIKQQKILNSALDEVILTVEQRRNILLRELKQKRNEYIAKLSQRNESVANQRSLLSEIKSKCEHDINNSAVASLQAAQKRANKTVQLMDETLLSVEQHCDESKINNNIYVKFDMSEQVYDDIKQWGKITVIGDKPPPPPPKINFVQVTVDRICIELLCDEHYSGVVSTFEYEFGHETEHKSSSILSRKSGGKRSKKKSRKSMQTVMSSSNESNIVNKKDMNVAFYWLTELQHSTEYKIRGRAVDKGKVKSDWSEWFVVTTAFPGRPHPFGDGDSSSDDLFLTTECKPEEKEEETTNDVTFPQEKCIHIDDLLCNNMDTALSVYELRRVFYYVKFLQETNSANSNRLSIDNVDVIGFESFINYNALHSAEWKEFQKKLSKLY